MNFTQPLAGKPWLFVIILCALLGGCSRTYDCKDPYFELQYIGYTKPEMDTLVIRKFRKDSNFQQLIDTVIIKFDTSMIRAGKNGALAASTQFSKEPILAAYDWQLFIPSTDKTISIAIINQGKETGQCPTVGHKYHCRCYNPVYSLKIDNQLVYLPEKIVRDPFININR
jgi:hypothetical protein